LEGVPRDITLKPIKLGISILFWVFLVSFQASGDQPSCEGSPFYIDRAKRLLEWNSEKLTNHSNLALEDLNELFAEQFVVIANEREYKADHRSYYEFLNKFRANITAISYQVQKFYPSGSTVFMPLVATVKRPNGKEEIFDAIMFVTFDSSGKIIHWQEVYAVRG
jgi:hypothetical protein